jgi:hypothetical protein
MKHNRYLLGLALLLAGTLPTFSQVSNDNEDEVYKIDARTSRNDFVPGQVLVKFKDANRVKVNASRGQFRSTSVNRITQVLEKFGAEEMEQLLPNENPKRTMRRTRAYNGETIVERDLSQLYCVKLSEEHAFEAMQLIDELKQMDEVEFAEPNYRLYTLENVTIDGITGSNPLITSQWYLQDYGVTTLWTKPIINHTRPVIAIIDTGVDMTHPDLAPNLWTNAGEVNGENGYDNDGNGFNNDLHGWDFINNTPNVRDFNMHGTHVAGIAAAANNNIGIIGANPRALIMPVSVMQSDGSGDVATIIKGINYAVANGATVLNLSLGTYANSNALRQALANAYGSAVIVAAAGNDGKCINTPHFPDPCKRVGPMFPAAYSFVLGVQATTQGGGLASFSNYDDDGNTFSPVTTLQDPDGFNYELKAPGTNMYSTIPGGNYKTLNGTSMAAPLVAGAISLLKMVKSYDTQEILWGDLLHTANIAQAYAVTNRPAELDLMKIMYRERKELTEETEEDYSGDGRIDAGETVSLYPVIRTTFGAASNIKMHLEMGDELEDPNTVDILTGPDNKVNFGLHLDAYGKGVSLNPLQLRIADDVANGRHIKMKFVATCDETNTVYHGLFTIIVDNITKLSGVLMEDMTLTSDKEYFVPNNLAIPQGVTLTIEPGTTIKIADGKGISSNGNLIAKGQPGKMIHFTTAGNGAWTGFTTGYKGSWTGAVYDENGQLIANSYMVPNDTLEYCIIDEFKPIQQLWPVFKNCVITTNKPSSFGSGPRLHAYRCNVVDCEVLPEITQNTDYTNYINNRRIERWAMIRNMNYFNNFGNSPYQLSAYSSTPVVDRNPNPSYLGTSRLDIADSYAYDIDFGNGFAQMDLRNMLTEPIAEAHGIVWKVCVNGKDAQDEYEDLAPLGVGKHKFEVYFNRPMNKAVTPKISFGVRDPWTQNAVAEDGSWNEEGTIYTAYKTVTGKTKSDGVNRIYVYGAEDDEFFEIPYEKTRFNIMINAAGSMATGFAAEAGLGRVNLTWDNSHNDFEDAMGFNIYRYELDGEGNEVNKTCLNQEIVDIETEDFTDYDVVPGTTYYYQYKVLSTDLQEYDVSNVVAATPLTSTLGDANGSGEVDVADVITTVNYAAGMEPKPFIFEAADMNADTFIDILDIIGIIQKILNPTAAPALASIESTAVYTIEDGVLYLESPVSLAGVQVQLNMSEKKDIKATEDLNGFEQVSTWLSDNDYLFLAYNLNGKTLSSGKNALLYVGDGDVANLRLSDSQGRNVMVLAGEGVTGIDAMGSKVLLQDGVFNLKGQKVAAKFADLQKLPKGVYIINGKKVVK